AVSRLLADPQRRRRMAAAGRAFVAERFPARSLAEGNEALYRQALAPGHDVRPGLVGRRPEAGKRGARPPHHRQRPLLSLGAGDVLLLSASDNADPHTIGRTSWLVVGGWRPRANAGHEGNPQRERHEEDDGAPAGRSPPGRGAAELGLRLRPR